MVRSALASAFAVLVSGIVVLIVYDLGRFATHMLIHIGSMNVAAPLLAACVIVRWPASIRPLWLWIATLMQIALLWAWHAPNMSHMASHSPSFGLILHVSLFLAALAFWLTLLAVRAPERWQSVPALLLTGKLACLLAALLIFAPRTLYEVGGHLSHMSGHLSSLDDQHLAGLLMITACPLSYLVAAVIITVQLISRAAPSRPSSPHHSHSFGG